MGLLLGAANQILLAALSIGIIFISALLGVGVGIFAPALGGLLILLLHLERALGTFLRRRVAHMDSTEAERSSSAIY